MNRKQRRAHTRRSKSAKGQSHQPRSHRGRATGSGSSGFGPSRPRSQHVPFDEAVPLRLRGLDPTLNASADSIDHADFHAHIHRALDAPHPAPFVHRASSFFAVALDEHLGLPQCGQLIKRIDDDDSLVGHALMTALSAMAPTADDRAHAQRMVERRPKSQRDELPSWLRSMGHARVTQAIEYSDLWWDQSFNAIELDIGGQALTVFLQIDHVAGFAVSNANLASESIAAFFAEFPETLIEPGTTHRYLDHAVAGRRFGLAIDEGEDDRPSVHADPDWMLLKPLVAWAGRVACGSNLDRPSTPAALFSRDDEPADRDLIKAAFLQGEHGQAASSERLTGGLETLMAYGTDVGHGSPLSWGPVRVADFLLRHIPENVWSNLDELRAMPDLLRHWINHGNDHCAMPPSMAIETLERIDECRPFYVAIIESRARSLADFTSDLVADR